MELMALHYAKDNTVVIVTVLQTEGTWLTRMIGELSTTSLSYTTVSSCDQNGLSAFSASSQSRG
jgi:hypothetical protein